MITKLKKNREENNGEPRIRLAVHYGTRNAYANYIHRSNNNDVADRHRVEINFAET